MRKQTSCSQIARDIWLMDVVLEISCNSYIIHSEKAKRRSRGVVSKWKEAKKRKKGERELWTGIKAGGAFKFSQ